MRRKNWFWQLRSLSASFAMYGIKHWPSLQFAQSSDRCSGLIWFYARKERRLFVGFFAGLLLDVMFGSIIGFYALIYMYIGYMNGFFKRIFFPDEVKLPLALIAVSDFFCNLLIYFLLFWFRGRFSFGYYLLHTMLPELVYTMIVSVLLYFILLKVNEKLEAIERRSAAKFG